MKKMKTAAIPLLLCLGIGCTEFASGVLSAERVAEMICSVINLSGGESGEIEITLKRRDGTELEGPITCDVVPDGATCNLSHQVAYPEDRVAAYCHVTTPDDRFTGNLRVEDRNGNTIAESPLEPYVFDGTLRLIAAILPTLIEEDGL